MKAKAKPRKLKVWVVCDKRGKPCLFFDDYFVTSTKKGGYWHAHRGEYVRRGVLTVEG